MPDPIGAYSPEAVIDAIETSMIDMAVATGRSQDGVIFRGADVCWVYTGFPALSRVMRAKFTDEEAEDRVAEIAECFHQWDTPVSWIVGPSTFPPRLPEYLSENGFGLTQTWMGMAADLSVLPLSPAMDGSLRIERVSGAEDLKVWTLLSDRPWLNQSTDGVLKILSPANAGSDPLCHFYLGYFKDTPVVRGLAYVKGDVAGLYWIDTDAAHRNAGFEAALASHALWDAKASGVKVAVIPARETESVMTQRLGFKIYCKLTVFSWPVPQHQSAVLKM